MKPTTHAFVSLGTSALFWLSVKSPLATVVCFLSGVFIDIDHHLDYFIAKRRIPWRYKDLVDYFEDINSGKLYLVLHSYELLFLLWMGIYFLMLNDIWLGLAVGATVHLACDALVNSFRPMTYFMFFRIKNRFDRKRLFTQEYVQKFS